MSEPMGDILIQTTTEETQANRRRQRRKGESETLQEKGVSSDLKLALPTAIILFALLTVTFPPALTKSCNMKQEVESHRAKDRCRGLVVKQGPTLVLSPAEVHTHVSGNNKPLLD